METARHHPPKEHHNSRRSLDTKLLQLQEADHRGQLDGEGVQFRAANQSRVRLLMFLHHSLARY